MRFFIIIPILTILAWSCSNRPANDTEENNYIVGFRIIKPSSINSDGVIFHVHADNELLYEVLHVMTWDSMMFSGGIFDTADYNKYGIVTQGSRGGAWSMLWGIGKQNEVRVRTSIFSFDDYNQTETDSISLIAFKDVEMNIYYKENEWTLKPLKDSVPDWSYLKLSSD